MDKIVFLLKTYIDDLEYVKRLILSYKKYNVDNIHLYISAPQSDIIPFEKFTNKNITVISDESVTSDLVNDYSVSNIRPGYINQEIIKLAFWEKGICENYLCLDSDGEFIRNFFIKDFMYDSETPYTILVEDNELKVDPKYYKEHWFGREKSIRKIQQAIGLDDRRILTCHGFAILSAKVLKSLYENYLLPNKLKYKDLLKISPYEFSWYNMWLQKDKTISIHFREHIFKYFHNKDQHLEYIKKGISLEDISRSYVGVVINSNYSRYAGVVSYNDFDEYLLSFNEIVSCTRKILRSIFLKIYQKIFMYNKNN